MFLQGNFLARNLFILTIGEAASRIVYAIAFIYLVRIFPPDVYGSVELTLSVTLILMIIVDMGLGVIGTREIARQSDQTDSLVRSVVSMRFGLAGLVFFLLLLVVYLVQFDRELEYLLVGYGASLFFYPLILSWVFQGWKRMAWVSIPQVLRQFTFALLVLLFIHNPAQVFLLPIFEVCAVAIAAGLNLLALRRYGSRLVIDLMRGWSLTVFRLAMPVGGTQLIWMFRMYLPILAVGAIAGQMAAGYFGAPHRIVMVLLALLAVYFINLFPSMSQASNISDQSLIGMINNSLRFTSWPSLIVALTVSISASRLIGLVFGGQYKESEAIQVISVLIWMIPIQVWRGHGDHALISLNHQQDAFMCSIVGFIFLIASLVLLIPIMGGTGAALAMIISEVLASALIWWRLKVRLPGTRLLQNIWHVPSLSVFKENFGKA